jgi:hypothetical protein
MKPPTSDQVQSALRHVYTATAAASAAALFIGLSQGDVTTLGRGVHQIGDGVALIIGGITTLIPVVSALYAAWTASPFSRLLNLNRNPEIKQVTTVAGTPTAALADAIPGSKIVSAPPPPTK